MSAKKHLPKTYHELSAVLGSRISIFNVLFQDTIRYYDSLLSQDARSSPGVEQHYLERFVQLLEQEGFELPPNVREALIKLTYGYTMRGCPE